VSEQCIRIDSRIWHIVGCILHLHSLVGEISRSDTITKYELVVPLGHRHRTMDIRSSRGYGFWTRFTKIHVSQRLQLIGQLITRTIHHSLTI
jgi:transcriptional regulator CtsR